MDDKLLTPAEAAKQKGVSRATIYAAIAAGRLKHMRVLGHLGISESDLLKWTPAKYKDRPGSGGGRPAGIPMSKEAKKKMSAAQKRRWAQRNTGSITPL